MIEEDRGLWNRLRPQLIGPLEEVITTLWLLFGISVIHYGAKILLTEDWSQTFSHAYWHQNCQAHQWQIPGCLPGPRKHWSRRTDLNR